MAFLDNSGDIVLDAVLTDTGRMRLARGDGSFKITKFALGDDEINYSVYDKSHASGSAYYDLEVLQTPVLEAFTNNASSMKSHLISIARNDLLYMPILKLNTLISNTQQHASGTYMIAVDRDTEKAFAGSNSFNGLVYGASRKSPYHIRIDQGIDAVDASGNPIISPVQTLDADLIETQYMLQLDNRFGSIRSVNDNIATVSFVDDDNIASYYLSLGTDLEYVKENTERTTETSTETIRGPRGTIMSFQIQSSLELNTSNYLFTRLGATTKMVKAGTETTVDVYYIDSTIRVQGATTGYSIDVPIRFIKLVG
mgnify:FL=1